jgi:hypothetical protein
MIGYPEKGVDIAIGVIVSRNEFAVLRYITRRLLWPSPSSSRLVITSLDFLRGITQAII